MTSRTKRRSATADEDFYSSLAAGAFDDEESEVSDADVDALTKALADMDDMDDALFSTSFKKKSPPDKKAGQESNTKKDDLLSSGSLGDTHTIRKGSSESRGSKTFTLKDDDRKDSPSPKDSPRLSKVSQENRKKTISKTFDFGEFDEDDPLAGLLSDEEETKPKPKPKIAPAKPHPEVKGTDDSLLEEQSTKAAPAKGSPKDDTVPPPARSRPKSSQKSEDLDFGDDDILGSMGFDESPRPKKILDSKEEEERQAAKSKVADLFGKSSKVTSPPEKPPAGRTREFVLDPKYKKQEKAKKPPPDEEDFSFGAYTPSAVSSRPTSAPPGRRSVRFADDEDLFGGTSTLGRHSRGPAKTEEPPVLSKTMPERQNKAKAKDENDDWLSLAVGGKVTSRSQRSTKEEGKSQVLDSDVTPSKKKAEVKDDQRLSLGDTSQDKETEAERRPSSAADYLGLGDDIDLDTLMSSKPPSPRRDGARSSIALDESASFPWEQQRSTSRHGRRALGMDALDTSADLGSTLDSKFLETLNEDAEENFSQDEGSLNSSLIAQQISQLAKMEENDQRTHQKETEQASRKSRSASVPAVSHDLGPGDGFPKSALRRQSSPGDTGGLAKTGEQSHGAKKTTVEGPKREPKWKQELRLRQQQQQQQQDTPTPSVAQPSSTQATPTLDLPTQISAPKPASNTTIPQGGAQISAASHSTMQQEALLGPPPTLAPHKVTPPATQMPDFSSSSALQQSANFFQDQFAQQQEQAKQFEEELKEQQKRMKEQQELQMQQLQRIQQDVLQQQLQMQQQMMQAQSVAPNPMMSFSSHPFQASFRSSAMDMKVKELEDEKRFLEQSLQSSQTQHKQHLEIKEAAHRDYIQLLEDSFKKKEARLIQENQELDARYQERMQALLGERSKIQDDHQMEMRRVREEGTKQRENLMQGHRSDMESLRSQHQAELEQMRSSMQQELQAVSEAQGHTRSLQAVVDQVGTVGQELGSLQSKLSGQHHAELERQKNEIQQKAKQLDDLQKRLQNQEENMSEERSRLEAMVTRLESHIRQQNTQLDEERWRLRQEQTKLTSLQKALDEERKISSEQLANQQISLQQAKDALLAEQQTNVAQMMEERKGLAEERAQLIAMRRELEASVRSNTEKAQKDQAERDGLKQSLLEDKRQVGLQTEELKRQREQLSQELRQLNKQKAEVEREREALQNLGERLKMRAKQIEDAVQDAVKVKEDGERALADAEKIASEYQEREDDIQRQIRNLKETQNELAQERLNLAEDQRMSQQLSARGLCINCQKSVLRIGDAGEGLILPSPLQIQPFSSTRRPTASHRFPLPAYDNIPRVEGSKEELVNQILHQAEMDHTVNVWRIAAEKDKEFLEEESEFLNSLHHSSSSLL